MPKLKFQPVEIMAGFVSKLPSGHELTGFTFEVSREGSPKHTVRANGGTYKELAEDFEGTLDQFVDELTNSYLESVRLSDEQFAPVIKEELDDSAKNPSSGESNPPKAL